MIHMDNKGSMTLAGLLLLLSVGVFLLFFNLPAYFGFVEQVLVLGVGLMLMVGAMGEMMRET